MINILSNASVLASAADAEVQLALTHGGALTSPPSGEVGAVASVTLDGVPGIAAAWRALLPSSHLTMCGVFCHSSPMVDVTYPTGSTLQCELADLLLVVDEVDSMGVVKDRRANLVQAKLLRRGTVKTDPVQHHLLTGWPVFSFSSGAYASKPRDFSKPGLPGHTHESGRYGVINFSSSPRVWDQNLPSSPKVQGATLGAYLVGMLGGTPGFGRQAVQGASDDWSSTVDELLNVTATQLFSHSGSLGHGASAPRGVVALVSGFAFRLESTSFAIDPPPTPDGPTEREERGGISIIYASAVSDGTHG